MSDDRPRYPLLKLVAYLKSRFLGDAASMVTLGEIFEAERGRQGIEVANQWYRDAARLGNAQAMYNLGVNHLASKGGATDHEQAVDWFKKAAAEGHAMATWALGNMSLRGRLVEQNHDRGIQLLEMAAQRGCRPAFESLIEVYRDGKFGIDPDPGRVEHWEAELARFLPDAS